MTIRDSNPSSTTTLRIDDRRAAWRRVGDESVILDLVESVYYGLNGTASGVWELLAAGATRDQLATALQEMAPADRTAEQVDDDLGEFLGALFAQGLISEVGA